MKIVRLGDGSTDNMRFRERGLGVFRPSNFVVGAL